MSYMIEKIVIRNFLDNNGIYYKVRKKRKLASDFGIFRGDENAYKRMEQLRKKGADKKWPTFNRYQP